MAMYLIEEFRQTVSGKRSKPKGCSILFIREDKYNGLAKSDPTQPKKPLPLEVR